MCLVSIKITNTVILYENNVVSLSNEVFKLLKVNIISTKHNKNHVKYKVMVKKFSFKSSIRELRKQHYKNILFVLKLLLVLFTLK